MASPIEMLRDPATTVAVVGAGDDLAKFGAIIYRDLKGKGIPVFGVNPGREAVDGDPAFASLSLITPPPSIVNFVVPPRVTLEVLRECLHLGLIDVWLQPGAGDSRTTRYLDDNNFNYVAGLCIMVESAPRR